MDNYHASTMAQPAASGSPGLWIWQAATVLLSLPAAVGCLLTVALAACAALTVMAVVATQEQVGQAEPVIDEFMTAMAARDVDSAYALLSTRSRRSASPQDLESLLAGSNFGRFEGYQRIGELVGIVAYISNTDELAPQGWVAQISGSVYYADGTIGNFDATLEREGDTWWLYGIYVFVPQEKLTEGAFTLGDGGVSQSGAQ